MSAAELDISTNTVTTYRCKCGETRYRIPGYGLGECRVCKSYLAIANAGAELATRELESLCLQAGRNNGPGLLLMAWGHKAISAEAVTALVGPIWSDAEFPQMCLSRRDWLELFAVAGYTVDGKAAPRPGAPVALYRGSDHSRRRRMSWTANREMAEWFATSLSRGRRPGCVYQTIAPPSSLLCFNGDGDNSRGESEYVVNTKGLIIKVAEAA